MPTTDPALVLLVDALRQRLDEIGPRLVERYRAEIVEYRALTDSFIAQDVLPTAVRNVEEMLLGLRSGDAMDEERLDRFRESAIRRFHQGVPVQALLHAYRLWAAAVWEEVQQAVADGHDPQAALTLAGGLMRHVDQVSTAVAQAYLEEASGTLHDREVLRRDLLEVLVAGRTVTERAARHAQALGLTLEAEHAVVLLRPVDRSDVARESLHAALKIVREQLDPRDDRPLMGLREDEVVAIYPAASSDERKLRQQADKIARLLPSFVVALGRRHAGAQGIARSYQEAQEAVAVALAQGPRGRLYAFSDALLDHVLRTSPFRGDLLEETVEPLLRHDTERQSELLRTLQIYVETRFNLTRTARRLTVHPNTIGYRLKRVHEVTGHDPSEPEGLLLLALGLKLHGDGLLPTG